MFYGIAFVFEIPLTLPWQGKFVNVMWGGGPAAKLLTPYLTNHLHGNWLRYQRQIVVSKRAEEKQHYLFC